MVLARTVRIERVPNHFCYRPLRLNFTHTEAYSEGVISVFGVIGALNNEFMNLCVL